MCVRGQACIVEKRGARVREISELLDHCAVGEVIHEPKTRFRSTETSSATETSRALDTVMPMIWLCW